MFRKTKLRGPIGRIYPIFFISANMLAVVEFIIRRQLISDGMEIMQGPLFITIIASLFLLVMGIYQWWRYHLWVYFLLGLVAGVSTLQSMCQYSDYFTLQSYIINILLVIILIVISWPVLAGHEKYERNARRLFKLAADNIMETSAGFTARPYSAGTAKYSHDVLTGFARFLKSKNIVNPVYRSEGIYMTASLGISPMLDPEPERISYVLFNKKGELSVHISAYDYRQYTRRFTFDQLCSSLGITMQRFLEYYKDGHEDRIINELKSV